MWWLVNGVVLPRLYLISLGLEIPHATAVARKKNIFIALAGFSTGLENSPVLLPNSGAFFLQG